MENPVIIVLTVLIVLLFVFFVVRSRSGDSEKRHVPNYKALFILGITFIPIGIATDNAGLWGMGIVFMFSKG
jgi:uncharacterized membrane protein